MGIREYSLEMRGMPRRDLVAYFISIGGKWDGKKTYFTPRWEVDLSDSWTCTIGVLQIPATQVTFRVDEEDWPEVVRAFRFNFLSAGG